MEILLVYKSKTDFTKRYAQIIAEELGCELIDFKDISEDKMSNYNTIVFGSRIHAGKIDGLTKAKEMFSKSNANNIVIFATGATPQKAKDIIDDMFKQNLSQEELRDIPHFYMESGMCYEKMGLLDKFIMKMVGFMMSKKKDTDSIDTESEQSITKSFDNLSKDNAMPLINYLKEVK